MNDAREDARARHAAEWGLASLLMGGTLVVLALIMLGICLQMFLGPRVWGLGDLRAIHYLAIFGGIVLIGMTIASIAFAIRSLVLAYKTGTASALGWAGLLVSIVALLAWIGTTADLLMVVGTLAGRMGLRL